jgi:RimJ/RimL family protein N-acetyltransferase
MRLDGPQPLATARLVLEPLGPDHARGLDRFARLWEVARYTLSIPHPYPPGCAETFSREAVEARRRGGGWVFAVTVSGADGMVGVADITLAQDRRGGELGYAFAPWAWGRGYATEAARALVRFGFGYLRLDLIEAHAMVENTASCRVLAKAGLARVGERWVTAPARGREVRCETYRAYWSQLRPPPA